MEWAAHVSGTARLIGQSRKMINLICEKTLDDMEPSWPAFSIYIIESQASKPIDRDRMFFSACTYL